MTMYHSWIAGLAWIIVLQHPQWMMVEAQGDPLIQPSEISSSDGLLDVTLTIDYGDITGPFYSVTNTRLLNGTYPGPTLRIKAGDTFRIFFQNNLEFQDGAVQSGTNTYHRPDHSNLHWHGSHVPSALPSDDVRVAFAPGESYQYEVTFPTNHMAGTHWIHPHVHGSSALQVGGGAILALIVEDEGNDVTLPTEISSLTEVVLVVHEFDAMRLNSIITDIADGKTDITVTGGQPSQFRTVNGQYQPEATIAPGEWQRWRIVWADWLGKNLDFQLNSTNCEMQLLAKDGIYIPDFPRAINKATIATGGRADVMIRCSAVETVNVLDYSGGILMTIDVTGTAVTSTAFSSFVFDYPAYLTDLTSTPPDTGCDCTTTMSPCPDLSGFCVNDEKYDRSLYLHTTAFGSVVERTIGGHNNHPYHQHGYPFQLISGPEAIEDPDEAVYFQIGDWQDVISASTTTAQVVRYNANVHSGFIMLHCHILTHEDLGTMAQELIEEGGSCQCDAFISTEAPSSSLAPSNSPSVSMAPSVEPTVAPTSTDDPCCGVARVAGFLFGEDARDSVQGWVEDYVWFYN